MLLLESCLQTCMTYTIAECTVNKLLMILYVFNLGVAFPEDGVDDAETCRSDIRLYIYVKGAFVGVINELFNLATGIRKFCPSIYL
jgi:hypothetical protein